jgi:hypothetical protein
VKKCAIIRYVSAEIKIYQNMTWQKKQESAWFSLDFVIFYAFIIIPQKVCHESFVLAYLYQHGWTSCGVVTTVISWISLNCMTCISIYVHKKSNESSFCALHIC